MRAKEEFSGAPAPRATSSGSGFVRVEYSGVRVGGVTYFGKDKRSYRFGNNPIERIQDVHPDDVQVFIGLEGFRVIGQKSPTVLEVEAPGPAPLTEEELESEGQQLLDELLAMDTAEEMGAQEENGPEFSSSVAEDLARENGLMPALKRGSGSGKNGAFTAADVRGLLGIDG